MVIYNVNAGRLDDEGDTVTCAIWSGHREMEKGNEGAQQWVRGAEV